MPVILLMPLAERRDTQGRFHSLTKPVRRVQLYARLCEALHLIEDQANTASDSPSSLTGASATGVSLPGDEGVFIADRHLKKPLEDFRLLLVEDNHTNQQVAVSTLAQMGYKIESVANGREALDALRAADYDLVFMDCHMPEMDGFEATAEIRRQETATRRTPIIAMTASALPEDRARCLAVGMDDYLTKPLHRHELRAVLERWLNGTSRDPNSNEVKLHASGSSESATLEHGMLQDLRHLGGANQGFLSELIDLFLQESVERLARMNEAATGKDMNALHHLAHTQRGASLNFGARQMGELCEELENISSSQTEAATGEVSEVLARLEREFFRVRRALEAERLPAATAEL